MTWGCPNCGRDNRWDARFCGRCGYDAEVDEDSSALSETPVVLFPRDAYWTVLDFVAILGALLLVAYLDVSFDLWSPLFGLVLAGEALVLVPFASPLADQPSPSVARRRA